MGSLIPTDAVVGYCTNVHAGATLDETRQNLARHACRVKELTSPDTALPIGLWLSARSLDQLLREGAGEFHDWMRRRGLESFTINGFPYGDFHQRVVKHDVYQPPWSDERRLMYTSRLPVAFHSSDQERSISTLPIGWRSIAAHPDRVAAAGRNLLQLADTLALRESETGECVHIDIEPEPGCYIQRSEDVVRFFKEHLLPGQDETRVLRHIRVCHDICHAAVMFEDQAEMFRRYRSSGIKIGKVQVSNAVRADLRGRSRVDRAEVLDELRQFKEERYLHQTMIIAGDRLRFHDDLPEALEAHESDDRWGDEWRVHFHVPIFLERFGRLDTTRDEIITCLRLLQSEPGVRHFEIETYAWEVLPEGLRDAELAQGIARELRWFHDLTTGAGS